MSADSGSAVFFPPRSAVVKPDDDDPIDYYYRPLTAWLYRSRLRLAARELGPGPFDVVLEVGYGSGVFLPELARRSRRVVGVDLHDSVAEALAALREVDVHPELSSGSVLDLPYADASFDALVCLSVLEHLRELDRAMSEMRRVIRPGGTAVLGFPVRNPVTDAFFRLAGYDPRAIHPSSHADILGAARAQPDWRVEAVRRFPHLLPTPLAAYVVCRCRVP